MDTHKPPRDLSRRERQIMNIVYRRGRASVADVLAELEDSPSYSALQGEATPDKACRINISTESCVVAGWKYAAFQR